jgi:hypothetical protein
MKTPNEPNPISLTEKMRISTLSSLSVVQSNPNYFPLLSADATNCTVPSQKLIMILNQALALLEDDKEVVFDDNL